MAAYITVGAKTSHGGTVITGSPHTTHNGIPVARKGDQVMCKKCKKVTTIVSGDASFVVDGAPIARGGDVTSCGAKLIANQQAFAESDFSVGSVAQAAQIKRGVEDFIDKVMGEKRYDDIFQLIDELTGEPLRSVEYIIEHATGAINGKTDEYGNTKKIELSQATTVNIKVPVQSNNSDANFKIFTHSLTPTNDTSTKQFKLQTKRALTIGEIDMAKLVFAESIDYSDVYIHNDEFLPFGLQNDNTAMTPNGEIYFPTGLYREDYSIATGADASLRHLFMHEMVHVWQHQLGYSVMIKGALLHPLCKLTGCDPYNYVLDSSKALGDYNMEQQGDIIADYYSYFHDTDINRIVSLSGTHYMTNQNIYKIILSNFIKDPSDANLLP
ncbi:PAAR domain-containing protein [Psychrobacter sp. AOP22-C1-C5]|uniref:PAAR domain-containing protein n=1 Tax=Psychrobacter sp. AOP22-C1-C5 TaxID=3457716 RepID=UPI00403750AB